MKKSAFRYSLPAFFTALVLLVACNSSLPSSTSYTPSVSSLGDPMPTNTTPPVDTPSFSQSEILAIVRNYLQEQMNKGRGNAPNYFSERLAEAYPKFQASYSGNREWRVLGLGYSIDEDVYYSSRGVWIVFETTLIVEPGNIDAETLLRKVRAYWN